MMRLVLAFIGATAFSGRVSPLNDVVQVFDTDNGVICYVLVESGVATKEVRGISCVKVK